MAVSHLISLKQLEAHPLCHQSSIVRDYCIENVILSFESKNSETLYMC